METKNKELLIDYIANSNPNFQNNSFFLNTNQIVFTLVEKLVYELAMLHFKRLNIEYDPNKYFIEYWWKNNTYSAGKVFESNELHAFHSDKDECLWRTSKKQKLEHPFLATVTYLNDSLFPTLITSTPDKLRNDNSQIILDKGLLLSFPKEMKHICFSPENLHGVYDVFKDRQKDSISYRFALMFNLWDHEPSKPTLSQRDNNNDSNNDSNNDNNSNNNDDNSNNNNTTVSINTQICETITPMSNKLSIKLPENEMFNFLKQILKKDTLIINNYITKETIYSYDIIEFDVV